MIKDDKLDGSSCRIVDARESMVDVVELLLLHEMLLLLLQHLLVLLEHLLLRTDALKLFVVDGVSLFEYGWNVVGVVVWVVSRAFEITRGVEVTWGMKVEGG